MIGAVTARPAGPALMLLASLGGMALGFAVDCRSLGPDTLASLCSEASPSLYLSVAHHWNLLRGTLVGMGIGGLAASVVFCRVATGAPWARLASDCICSLAMLAGMLLGGWLGPAIAATVGADWGALGMFAAMAIGMIAGLATWMLLADVAWRGVVEMAEAIDPRPANPTLDSSS